MQKYNICVISLFFGENYRSSDDLVAGYLTSVLRCNGDYVDFLEISKNHEKSGIVHIQPEIRDVVILTIPTTSNNDMLITLSEYVKQKNPSCYVVWSGWDHHSAPIDVDFILTQTDTVDVIIRGEGEITIIELINMYKQGATLSDCKGISYKSGKTIIHNPDRQKVFCLDDLPFPARDTFKNHNFDSIRISTARGCVGQCSFCPVPATRIKGVPVWRGRSPQNIISEIKYLHSTFGINLFMFIDPTFEDPGKKGKARVREIAELILAEKLDIYFLVNMRAENWTEDDMELLKLLYIAGLETVSVGLEAGNRKGLDLFNKIATHKDFFRFIHLLNNLDIYPAYGFIMFHPYLTFADLQDNLTFIRKIGLGYMMGAFLNRLKAFPQTAIYNKLSQDNLLNKAEDSDLYKYIFKNASIARLAGKMKDVQIRLDEQPSAHYYTIQKVTTFISRIHRKILKNNDELPDAFITLRNKAIECKKQLSNINCNWFAACIDWAAANGSDEEFSELTDRHFLNLEEHMTQVRNLQMKKGMRLLTYLR